MHVKETVVAYGTLTRGIGDGDELGGDEPPPPDGGELGGGLDGGGDCCGGGDWAGGGAAGVAGGGAPGGGLDAESVEGPIGSLSGRALPSSADIIDGSLPSMPRAQIPTPASPSASARYAFMASDWGLS